MVDEESTAPTEGGSRSKKTAGRMPPHRPLNAYYADDAQRRALLRDNFDSVARSYDRINRLAALGTDVRYRCQALQRAGVGKDMRIVDVACGTGVTSALARELVGERGAVIGVDPSEGMIAEGVRRERFQHVVRGVAEALPLPGDSADFLTMTYALRHVVDLVETFREFHRVLRPGGRLLILEMTIPESGWRRAAMKFHVKHVTPLLAKLVAGSREARWLYRYCWESHEQSVRPDTLLGALAEVGFADVSRHVEMGIFSEYTARKP